MRIVYSDRHERPLVYHRHKHSLLAFWIYWPQKMLIFLWAFVTDGIVSFLKDKALLILYIGILLLIGYGSLATFEPAHPSTLDQLINNAANWIEIIGGVLFVLVLLLKSYDTTTGKTNKHRITYTRPIDDGGE